MSRLRIVCKGEPFLPTSVCNGISGMAMLASWTDTGYVAGRKGLKVPVVLCERHLLLANSALEFVAAALKGGH